MALVCVAVINVIPGIFYLQRDFGNTERDQWLTALMIAGCVFSGFLVVVVCWLIREIIQALFDVADCSLSARSQPSEA